MRDETFEEFCVRTGAPLVTEHVPASGLEIAANLSDNEREKYQKSTSGRLESNVANALKAVRERLPDYFAFDMMARSVMLMRGLDGENNFDARLLTDVDVTAIQVFLQHLGLRKVSKDTVHQAIDKRADECGFHPVREYLENLRWDFTPRAEQLFSRYFGADHTEYSAQVSRMFLLSMIARVMRPGCKVDHMPVIEGPQGALKSTACRILGGEWFSDHLPEIGSGKDTSQHLRGKWIIEVPELGAMTRAETTHIKAFITRQAEQYRPSYGRKEVVEPRQCVFIGTTNQDAYLRDETGGRRFWPIKSGSIDVTALKSDRDQIFAEALVLFRNGWPWWPDKDFESNVIAPEQSARYETDAWEETIREYLRDKTQVTVSQVGREAVGILTQNVGRREQNRVMASLERLGWKRQPQASDGKRWWAPR